MDGKRGEGNWFLVFIVFMQLLRRAQHPIHLHGVRPSPRSQSYVWLDLQHAFDVVQSAGDNMTFKFKTPVRRDVVCAGTQGQQMVVRWVTDNAGPWFGSYTSTFVYRMCNLS